MKRGLFALAGLVIAAPLALAADSLSLVQAHLAAVDTMTADFTQTGRDGRTVSGVLTLKKPGRIRFQYEKGVPILVVGDGKSLWFLDYQVGQKQRWPIDDAPLGVLLDPSKDATRYAKIVPGADPGLVQVEAADPKHPDYGRITLVFQRQPGTPGGLQLQGWTALDAQSNRTVVRLSNQRFNQPVSDATFRFNEPRAAAPRR
ncbi:outer membrane lipoprotein carrier protein LolA [Sphingomonas sp.]|uniref:LolA family protein n=1 Tax=Sphingomonas sp. TaxID=28214 RepID=UPI0025D7F792|nr:outer membrane lipoprotein carrier protein LolA [Sphingomonas sp.]